LVLDSVLGVRILYITNQINELFYVFKI
jgi:hypothetical protein